MCVCVSGYSLPVPLEGSWPAVSMRCIFPCGLLAVISFLAGGMEVEGFKAEPGCELRLHRCSRAVTDLSGWRWRLRGWSRSPEGVGCLQGVMAVSTVVWDMAGAWGLGVPGFTFYSSAHNPHEDWFWLKGWYPTPSRVHMETHSLPPTPF